MWVAFSTILQWKKLIIQGWCGQNKTNGNGEAEKPIEAVGHVDMRSTEMR